MRGHPASREDERDIIKKIRGELEGALAKLGEAARWGALLRYDRLPLVAQAVDEALDPLGAALRLVRARLGEDTKPTAG